MEINNSKPILKVVFDDEYVQDIQTNPMAETNSNIIITNDENPTSRPLSVGGCCCTCCSC